MIHRRRPRGPTSVERPGNLGSTRSRRRRRRRPGASRATGRRRRSVVVVVRRRVGGGSAGATTTSVAERERRREHEVVRDAVLRARLDGERALVAVQHERVNKGRRHRRPGRRSSSLRRRPARRRRLKRMRTTSKEAARRDEVAFQEGPGVREVRRAWRFAEGIPARAERDERGVRRVAVEVPEHDDSRVAGERGGELARLVAPHRGVPRVVVGEGPVRVADDEAERRQRDDEAHAVAPVVVAEPVAAARRVGRDEPRFDQRRAAVLLAARARQHDEGVIPRGRPARPELDVFVGRGPKLLQRRDVGVERRELRLLRGDALAPLGPFERVARVRRREQIPRRDAQHPVFFYCGGTPRRRRTAIGGGLGRRAVAVALGVVELGAAQREGREGLAAAEDAHAGHAHGVVGRPEHGLRDFATHSAAIEQHRDPPPDTARAAAGGGSIHRVGGGPL
mmetsp:Transcript_16364/g.66121  ORF Transcript_16364/g.66121 Transcript_16364/m.66121 type:complete len:452 (-) Transcript_16364:381-1736(-)